jgi:putative hemolysin
LVPRPVTIPNYLAQRLPASACEAPHIVGLLIEERARHLKHNRAAWPWPLNRLALNPLLRYRAAIHMPDVVRPLSGREVFDHVTGLLDLHLSVAGLARVPRTGPCLIVANHPTGIVDGIVLHQSLKGMRDDLAFLANRDALRVAPRLAEVVVPAESVVEKRSVGKTRCI